MISRMLFGASELRDALYLLQLSRAVMLGRRMTHEVRNGSRAEISRAFETSSSVRIAVLGL
jgi:hypothetical protein